MANDLSLQKAILMTLSTESGVVVFLLFVSRAGRKAREEQVRFELLEIL